MTNKQHIGFIGMGSMGSLMTLRLLQVGYHVHVYDRTKEKTREAILNGARAEDTPRDLAIHTDVIMSCVTDYHALSEVMYGEQGAIAGAKKGMLFIDLSTIAPDQSRHLAERIRARGASMIDAAVSGSTQQAKTGSLIIFVGGDKNDYEQTLPILKYLGKNIFYIGESGQGTAMKMVVNTLLGLEMQAIAEAVSLGEKAGLERNLLLDVLGQTTVIAPAHKPKLQNYKKNDYQVNFSLALMRKDFSLIMRLATEHSVPMPATAAAEQMYAAALARGIDADFSVIMQFMHDLASGETTDRHK